MLDFDGPICENKIDDCADVTCHNGGVCVDSIRAFTRACKFDVVVIFKNFMHRKFTSMCYVPVP